MSSARYPRLMLAGALVLVLLIGLILAAPLIAPAGPLAQDTAGRLEGPGPGAWLGTDRYGRDVLARLLYGGRATLTAAAAALASVALIGVSVGLVAGYLGGIIDKIVRSVIDVLLAFPPIILALVVVGLFGPGLRTMIIAMASIWWVAFAQLTRSIAVSAKHDGQIDAARAIGASTAQILVRELLPRAFGPVMVLATLELGHVILAIAALSYLGLGAQPPSPEWGAMLADGRAFAAYAPHLLLAPAGAVLLLVLGLSCFGEGLREHMERAAPTLRNR